ncbi:MAG: hypothetical protein HY799_03355 [Nitrosomonadales bacterium]|nr:hypothetical protein [Nitrosomonadales bacterium]
MPRDDMTNLPNHFAVFISQQLEQFAGEAERLGDRQPLAEYETLVDTFFDIAEKLGTIEHEFALAKLSSEFKLASAETTDAWHQIWRDFKNHRQHAIKIKHTYAEHDQKAEVRLADLEKSFLELPTGNNELRQSMRAAIDAATRVTKAGKGMGTGWSKVPWLSLSVNLRIYSVYLRYLAAKFAFFLFRHGLILLASILVLGIAYSQFTKALIEQLAGLAPQWPWLAAALTLGVYLFKKYYLDSKMKKLQTTLETKRLKPLAFNLHVVRTLALMTKTLKREPIEKQTTKSK